MNANNTNKVINIDSVLRVIFCTCLEFPNYVVLIAAKDSKYYDYVLKHLREIRRGEVNNSLVSKEECLVRFDNGSSITVRRINESLRGYRAHQVLLIGNVSDEMYNDIVFPISFTTYFWADNMCQQRNVIEYKIENENGDGCFDD